MIVSGYNMGHRSRLGQMNNGNVIRTAGIKMPVCTSIDEIQVATPEDAYLQKLKTYIIHGWPKNNKLEHIIRHCWPIRSEL